MERGGRTLAEVERYKRFAGVCAVAVDDESNRRCASEGAPKTDDAKEDSRHNPQISLLGTPSEAHQSDDGTNGNWNRHDEAELGLVHAIVLARHEAHDQIGHFSSDGCSEDAADKGRDVDEADLQRCEVVGCIFINMCNRFGENDEPSYGESVYERGPKHGRVCKENEWSNHHAEPFVLDEAPVPWC